MAEAYLNNPLLKRANTQMQFTKKQVNEWLKCSQDPVYFAKKYVKIVQVDQGLIPFDMYDFQEDMMNKFHNNRFNIAKLPRQCGKSTTVIAYLVHYMIFNQNVTIGILANKASISIELLDKLQKSYENLPKWLQHGVISWNKKSVELDNGSRILAESTSSSAVRGMTFNIIFLDEFAFVPTHIAEQFFNSVYPTISSGKSTKVIIISTPNGMNMFYKLWHDAELGKNNYIPTEVHWSQVPGRDDAWKRQTIANTSPRQFEQEFECSFLGSVDTLISAHKLRSMVYDDPIQQNKGLTIYENPKPKHDYIITVDVSRGLNNDYSAFIIFDVTEVPYKVVGKYRNNTIKPMVFPDVIHEVAKNYNKAYVLVEVNDIGGQVADILHQDMEYDNLLMCSMRGRAGQLLGQGFSTKCQLGLKMTATTKKTGCSNLKAIVESDRLLINDYEIISELTTFIQKNNTFMAEQGANDDLAMCLVIFAWVVVQPYFKEMTSGDVRKNIADEERESIEEDMVPFGFINDGLRSNDPEDGPTFVDADGNLWFSNEAKWANVIEDEYGKMGYMWDYM